MAARGGSGILAVILGLTLVAVEAPSLHQHRDSGPAWYDEECPGLRLAVASTDPGVLPVVDQVHAVAPVDSAVPATPAQVLRGCLSPTDPRAPPIPA
jgi:hypothetical protein